MDAQLKKGFIEFCVLCVLENNDSYGYEIMKKTNVCITFSESTLYSLLKRMEDSGYVTAYTEQYNNRLRKYFHLSDKGKEYLNLFRKDITKIKDILNFIENGIGDCSL